MLQAPSLTPEDNVKNILRQPCSHLFRRVSKEGHNKAAGHGRRHNDRSHGGTQGIDDRPNVSPFVTDSLCGEQLITLILKRNGLPSPCFPIARQIDGNDIVAGSSQCGDGGDLGNPGL